MTGYALSFWRVRGADILFIAMMIVAFIPYHFSFIRLSVFLMLGIGQSLLAIIIVHTIFGLPTMTLLFRITLRRCRPNLFKAARIDGASFYRFTGAS